MDQIHLILNCNNGVDLMPSPEKPAIVLAPYGSLSPRALATYERIRKAYEREFPGSQVQAGLHLAAHDKEIAGERGNHHRQPSGSACGAALQGMQECGGPIPADRAGRGVPPAGVAGAGQGLESQEEMPAFERLEIGLPLLSSLEDCRRVSRVLPAMWNGSGSVDGDNAGEGSRACRACRALQNATRKKKLCFWRATAQATRRMPSIL